MQHIISTLSLHTIIILLEAVNERRRRSDRTTTVAVGQAHWKAPRLPMLLAPIDKEIPQPHWNYWLSGCLMACQHTKVNLCQLQGNQLSQLRMANEIQCIIPYVTR